MPALVIGELMALQCDGRCGCRVNHRLAIAAPGIRRIRDMINRHIRSFGAGLVLLLSCGLLVAGCGGGGDDDTRSAPGSGVARSAVTDQVGTVTGPADATSPTQCAIVPLAPNTDAGFFDIEVVGIDCAASEEFLRSIESQTRPGGGGLRSFDADGFACEATDADSVDLPSVTYFCVGGEQSIRFVRN